MRHGAANGFGQRACGGVIGASESRSEQYSVTFVRVFFEDCFQLLGGELLQHFTRGNTALRVHAHVERAVRLKGETTSWVVDLHGGQA